LGSFLDRLGRPVAGANAFIDYADTRTSNFENASLALDNALAIVGRLRGDASTADQPEVVNVYERVLPVAIQSPFSRKEFAYEYARRLQAGGRFKEAVEQFRQVPAEDARATLARFFEMVALQQRLDQETLAAAERQEISLALAKLVGEVQARVGAALKAATDEQERLQYRSMLVRTTLLAADAARREGNDPKQTLALLENFESLAQGLRNEKDLIGNVLYTRVQAYMGLGDSDAATRTLVELLKSKPGGEGATIV
jgi:tetratricopeptide (TPR) repeat protein